MVLMDFPLVIIDQGHVTWSVYSTNKHYNSLRTVQLLCTYFKSKNVFILIKVTFGILSDLQVNCCADHVE
jgi:hypothetical protein